MTQWLPPPVSAQILYYHFTTVVLLLVVVFICPRYISLIGYTSCQCFLMVCRKFPSIPFPSPSELQLLTYVVSWLNFFSCLFSRLFSLFLILDSCFCYHFKFISLLSILRHYSHPYFPFDIISIPGDLYWFFSLCLPCLFVMLILFTTFLSIWRIFIKAIAKSLTLVSILDLFLLILYYGSYLPASLHAW